MWAYTVLGVLLLLGGVAAATSDSGRAAIRDILAGRHPSLDWPHDDPEYLAEQAAKRRHRRVLELGGVEVNVGGDLVATPARRVIRTRPSGLASAIVTNLSSSTGEDLTADDNQVVRTDNGLRPEDEALPQPSQDPDDAPQGFGGTS